MEIKTTKQLSKDEKQSIFQIWNEVYPKQIMYKTLDDLENYLAKCTNSVHLLAKHNGETAAWLCVFDRDGQRWFALIVDASFQRQGIGEKMLSKMKTLEDKVYGWMTPHNRYEKANGEKYLSPKGFYEKHGFAITDEVFDTDILSTVKIVWQR